jgi:hypothetical protein
LTLNARFPILPLPLAKDSLYGSPETHRRVGLVPSLMADVVLGVSIFGGNMKQIPLTQGKVALVDDEDFEELNQFKWCANKMGKTFYAERGYRCSGKSKTELMHRQILNAPSGMEVDHINHNTLDNRRENIRICTLMQNRRNRKRTIGGSSRFKGVSWNKEIKKWTAQIGMNEKIVYLGAFTNEEDAAHARDKKEKELFGEFACLNFPKGVK